MEDVVLLTWSFTPKDYFEDEIRVEREDYSMIIMNGVVEARIKPDVYGDTHALRDSLHSRLNDRFLGIQLLTHKQYDLSNASMCRLHADGRKSVAVFPKGLAAASTVSSVDLMTRDKDGSVVSDSRSDRVEKKRYLADLAEKYSSDTVAASLLESYKAAVNDPEKELVHLYEIRDALSKLFESEASACKTLGLSSAEWSRLGQLANSKPIEQGRHRGKSPGGLRDATDDELAEARTISRNFVEAYLNYLDRCHAHSTLRQ